MIEAVEIVNPAELHPTQAGTLSLSDKQHPSQGPLDAGHVCRHLYLGCEAVDAGAFAIAA